ncbi:UDP-N-acetyl-D-mannosamine dehydrogenase [BD1-7 clade bacterium]|uniref:UDP-N-acetyl-D-mannosamine dehydrogenase n=1 Tax=BD1-7 clade bacterium TaxID=2029982 RepID=A0A5S9QZA4_9GAMM|nr:UDP-N-acetyl-D-mannosamine dehydrogenase [BD1-7 clade bacterium]
MSFETISVVGLGYIGLPTAAMFASRKIKVIGVDVNQHAVDTINKGEIHIVEPDLDMLVHAAVTQGYLKAATTPEGADAFLIAVPTPFKGDHEPDLSYIEAAAKAIAPVIEKGNLVILESTSPVGATEEMAKWIAEARPDLSVPLKESDDGDIFVAHCPERVLPGHVVRELVENDRVIGGINSRSSEKAVELYQSFVVGECVVTNARTAEMAKLTENASRDVSIAFANELSLICDELAINVWELIELANRHPRVNILQPGPGVGGHCIAVDPWFIINKTPEHAVLTSAARAVNDGKPGWTVSKVEQQVSRFLEDNKTMHADEVTVACFGLAFKPDIDDLRESPALEIAKQLTIESESRVVCVEPNVEGRVDGVEIVDLLEALEIADIYVLLVDHKQFKKFNPKCEYIVDTRGIW